MLIVVVESTVGLTAEFLVSTFGKTTQNKSIQQIIGNGRNTRYKLASFNTEVDRKCIPLGFRWMPVPDKALECDLPLCSVRGSSEVKLLAFAHSFHSSCVKTNEELLPCPLCWPNLRREVCY